MECLFDAWVDSAVLGYSPVAIAAARNDLTHYCALKVLTHGWSSQMTSGAATPFIIQRLARRHDVVASVEHRLMTPAMYRAQARSLGRWRLWLATFLGDFGPEVEAISMAPAIYCQISPSQHAYAGFHLPWRGVTVMALHIRRSE